jgi:hypothetical protein
VIFFFMIDYKIDFQVIVQPMMGKSTNIYHVLLKLRTKIFPNFFLKVTACVCVCVHLKNKHVFLPIVSRILNVSCWFPILTICVAHVGT